VGIVVAHEFAHVEESTCDPDSLPEFHDYDAALTEYMKLTGSVALRREALADLRGIRNLREALANLNRLIQTRDDFRAVFDQKIYGRFATPLTRLGVEPDRAVWSALSAYLEYSLIVSPVPELGIHVLQDEPSGAGIEDVGKYYEAAAEGLWHRGCVQPFANHGHMIPAFRVAIAMHALDYEAQVFDRLPRGELGALDALAQMRLEGSLVGHITGLLEKISGRSQSDAHALADEFAIRVTLPRYYGQLVEQVRMEHDK
jgi:hypothetical protein